MVPESHTKRVLQTFGLPGPVLAVLLFCSMVLGPVFAVGASIPWLSIPYSHIARGEQLADILRNFGMERGVSVVVSEQIADTVHGAYEKYSPQQFFDEVCRAYGLIWFYDGATCYIYRQNEIKSAIIPLGKAGFADVSKSIDELGISNNNIPIRQLAGKELIYVTGTPMFVELAQTATTILNTSAARQYLEQKQQSVIRAFRLKNAWATDHKFIINDEEVTVPGVATELKNLLNGDFVPDMVGGTESKQLSATVDKLRGSGLAARDNDKSESLSATSSQQLTSETATTKTGNSFSIQADARLNAVIVRDTRDRLPFYEELIDILDVPASLINIEVTIAEVSAGSLRELGVKWRYENSDARSNVHDLGFGADESNFEQGATGLGTGLGLNLATTLSLSASEYLLAKLNVLEDSGKASIQSKPSLLTLDNIQAVIQQTTTFYTRVAGTEDVDLFKVTSGLVLKVVPHIIWSETGDSAKIKLLVDIEDGDPDAGSTVDEIPTVSQNSIHTQAVVGSGETLLLGGNIYEKTSLEQEKVPFLGDIPLLGYLFKNETNSKQRLERIFMIRPTLHQKWVAEKSNKRFRIHDLAIKDNEDFGDDG